MARIVRTAPAPLEEAPRRIMRVSRSTEGAKEKEARHAKALQMVDNHLQLIAMSQKKIDYLRGTIQPDINKEQLEIDRLKGVLEGELRELKLPGYTNGQWEARFVTAMTKSSKEIDAAQVQKKLAPADFLKVIKVQVTPLRTFMSEREIARVSRTIPAAPGAVSFVVQPVVTKKDK